MQHTRLESSESGGWSIEHSKRKAERQSGADFVYRAAIGESVRETDVETEIVANLPNGVMVPGESHLGHSNGWCPIPIVATRCRQDWRRCSSRRY